MDTFGETIIQPITYTFIYYMFLMANCLPSDIRADLVVSISNTDIIKVLAIFNCVEWSWLCI